MQAALVEANKALELGEVPVGAVVVDPTGEIIGRAAINLSAVAIPPPTPRLLLYGKPLNTLAITDCPAASCMLP